MNQSLRLLILGLSGLAVADAHTDFKTNLAVDKNVQIKTPSLAVQAIDFDSKLRLNQLDAQMNIEAFLKSFDDIGIDDVQAFVDNVKEDDRLRDEVFKVFDVLTSDSKIQELQAFRDLSQPVSFKESVQFLAELLSSRGVKLEVSSIESIAKLALIAGEAAEISGFEVLKQGLTIGAVNRGDAMCQSCAMPSAITQTEILARMRLAL